MATVAECRMDIKYNCFSKYYCVCGVYVFKVVDETKHCSEASKYDDMEVVKVDYINGEYQLWIRM